MRIIDINPDGTSHETILPDPELTSIDARESALTKLAALGLSENEILALLSAVKLPAAE